MCLAGRLSLCMYVCAFCNRIVEIITVILWIWHSTVQYSAVHTKRNKKQKNNFSKMNGSVEPKSTAQKIQKRQNKKKTIYMKQLQLLELECHRWKLKIVYMHIICVHCIWYKFSMSVYIYMYIYLRIRM